MNFLPTLFSRKQITKPSDSPLQLETLEPRMMLSTVTIFASGTEGGEQFQVQVNGAVAETFQIGVGTDILNDQTFTFETADTITADDLRIEFINDTFDANTGFDSNLIVDAVEIDGTRFETESSDVFSTGTFIDADGITPGFRQSETLHANGFFQYSDGNGGTFLTIQARGSEGGEQFRLILNGETVQTFTTTTQFQNFGFNSDRIVGLSDIEIEFFGDQFLSLIHI